MDSPTTSAARTRGGVLVKAIHVRELRGGGSSICDIIDEDSRRGTGGDTTKLLKALRRRELRGHTTVNIHGNLFERNRQEWVYQKDLKGHKGCVNAVEFSPQEDYIVSGGDDCNVQIWRSVNCCLDSNPQPLGIMDTQHESNIFALRFSLHTDRIYSGGNDYQLLIHDIQTKALIRSFTADKCFYRISNHPANDSVIAAACEDGHVHIYDIRMESDQAVTKIELKGPVYSVEYNKQRPSLMAVCSNPDGLQIYDLRNTKGCYAQAGLFTKNAICADWSPDGRAIFAIISRANPIYFNLDNSEYIELRDPDYQNLCTLKSCTFVGPDYLVTGSDNWNIYVWKVPHKWDDEPIKQAYTVLNGHRSIVNHIRYSDRNNILVSCGVEKIVKCWSATELPSSYKNPPRRARSGGIFIDRSESALDPDSMDEDLQVLYTFDHFYERAVQNRESDDDSMSLSMTSEEDEEESVDSQISVMDIAPSEIDGFSDHDQNVGGQEQEEAESDQEFIISVLENC
uniref:Uncharacterized protein n=1 Tax=Ditylenchus dipsaci TaxID=166011 RepID=A0A915CZY3_9BILA